MELKKKLQELRKELWDYLHDMQEWGIKDTVMENLDKAIKELEKLEK